MNLRTVAIIVTYNPEFNNLSSLVKCLERQGTDAIIIDNNSKNKEQVNYLVKKSINALGIFLPNNIGIAAAQNQAISLADSKNYELYLFFDQDTQVNQADIVALINEYIDIQSKIEAPLVLGPTFYHTKSGFEYPQININQWGIRYKFLASNYLEPKQTSCLISSGMVLSKFVLDKVGRMDDKLFIDYVDTEFCLRANHLGVSCFVTPNVKIKHEIGDNTLSIFKWKVPVHSPVRRYYRIRNAYYLLTYKHVPKVMAFREIIFSFIHQAILIVFLKNKCQLIKMWGSASYDGIKFLYKKYLNVDFK